MGRFLIVLCLVLPSTVLGDPIKVIFENGQPVEVHLADGRKMGWFLGRRPGFQLRAPFKITENTCNGREGMTGTLKLGLVVNQLRMQWIAHPDPAKIGATVGYRLKPTPAMPQYPLNLMDEPSILTGDARKLYPVLGALVPGDTLQSDDFSWLPGVGEKAPLEYYFARWDSESMMANPETFLNENRTNGIALGAEFRKIADDEIELTNIKNFLGTRLAFFIGDLWAVILKDGEGFCQLTQKADFKEVIKSAGEYFASKAGYAPYTFGSDEYSTDLRPSFARKSWEGYEFE